MTHFFGIVKGAAYTTATRNGDRSTGLGTTAASPQGAVTVDLYVKDDVDWAKIRLTPWKGEGIDQVIYHGPVGGGLGLKAYFPRASIHPPEEIEEADANTEEYRRTQGRMNRC